MGPEAVQVASLSDVFFSWFNGHPEQVIFLLASSIALFVLLKRDRFG